MFTQGNSNQGTQLPQPFQGNGGWGNNNSKGASDFLGPLGGIISGAMGQGGKSYEDFQKMMMQMLQQGTGDLNPFIKVGTGAINPFLQSLMQMQDPTGFMKNIMGQYSESPWAKFQTHEGLDAATNAASATGMTGSGVHQKAAADYARNIASQDQQQFFQNAMGVKGGFLNGLKELMGLGQNSAGTKANVYGNAANAMATAAQNQTQGQQQDWMSMLGGAMGLAGLVL